MTITRSQIDQLVDGQRVVLVSDIGEFPPLVGTVRLLPWGCIDVRPADGGPRRFLTQRDGLFKPAVRTLFVEPPKPPSIYSNVERTEVVRGDVVSTKTEAGRRVVLAYKGDGYWMAIPTGAQRRGDFPGEVTLLVDGATGKAVQA